MPSNFVSPFPIPLNPEAPQGSLVYDSTASASINSSGDTDSFTILLNAGQTATVAVVPATGLQAMVSLSNSTNHLLGSAQGGAAGQEVVLQTVPIAAADTYTITIQGLNATTGSFTVQLVLNAALQTESNGGTPGSDDTIATAQNIDSAFGPLGHGGSRAAVLGDVPGGLTAGDVFVDVPNPNGPGGNILLCDKNGNLLNTFTNSALNAGHITGLELGPDNTLYVGVDTSNNGLGSMGNGGELVHLDTSGNLLGIIPLPNEPSNPNGYYYPKNFRVAPDGTFWVSQLGFGTVIHVDGKGNLIRSYSVGGFPDEIAVRSDGQVFIANWGLSEVQQLDPVSGNVSDFVDDWALQWVSFAQSGGNGDLVVSDWYGTGITYYNRSGGVDKTISVSGDIKAEADPAGNTLALNWGTLLKYDVNGNLLFSTNLTNQVPAALAVYGVDGGIATPPDTNDYYSFTLTKGQSTTIDLTELQGSGATFDLENGAGQVLALPHSADTGLSLNEFVAQATGTYYIHVMGFGVKYDLVVTKNSDFDTGPNQALAQAQPLGKKTGVLGYEGTNPNYYSFNVQSGDFLTLTTSIPSAGPGQFQNTFDPMLILYGPDGSVLASDDNSAGDGRNARITYPATEAGVYTVEVLPSPLTPSPTSGEYVLSLTGNTGIAPFTVTSTSLAANSLVVSLSSITVDFSNPIYLPSLSNSSLTVDGIAATGFTVNNDHEVVFTLPALSSTGHDVKHKIQIGSTLQDIQGKALEGFSEVFYVDNLPPQVIKSSVEEGDVLKPGDLKYVVTFDDTMDPSVLSTASFDLHGVYHDTDYAPVSYSFNQSDTVLTITYQNLVDDDYTLTLYSEIATDGGPITNVNGFRNIVGLALDGTASGENPPVPGGNFVVDFRVAVEKSIPFPQPLQVQPVMGDLVYQGSTTDVITAAGDSTNFLLKLRAGQTITADLTSDNNLQGAITIYGPDGSVVGSTVTAEAQGGEAVLQTLLAQSSGQYCINIAGANQTLGLYNLQVTLNAALEDEAHGGSSNDSLGSAQDLAGAFVALPGNGSRAAVLGQMNKGWDLVDYYSFAASSVGQSISLGVHSNTGTATLELFDANGNLVALGTSGPAEYDQVIANMVVTATGTYYVEVQGTFGMMYNLVITRGLALDTEPNNTQAQAQDITATRGASGGAHLARSNRPRTPTGIMLIRRRGTTCNLPSACHSPASVNPWMVLALSLPCTTRTGPKWPRVT